ncbi:hypothetical protein BC941DRAFT_497490 [Chlamydoabsidia padenii]|nr:hypothetical protein BC941DRAFT_497490 [Chlamydoabsidia padenii]
MSASNMTVNSEDLTAKEFADMAGIKIIPDNDDDHDHDNDDDDNDDDDKYYKLNHEDQAYDTHSSIMAKSITSRTHQQHKMHQPTSSASSIVARPSYFSYHAGDENNWSVGSTASQHSGTAKIWNNDFWKRPTMEDSTSPLRKHRSALLQHRQTLSLPPPIPASKVHGQHAKSKSTIDLPIVHELKRIHSASNNTGTDPQVIRKGRFEIQLESST